MEGSRIYPTVSAHLLGLDGGGVLPAEAELGDGDVVEDDVEVPGAVGQLLADHHGDLLALRDQLRGVELGHHALQHLVADGRQHLMYEKTIIYIRL